MSGADDPLLDSLEALARALGLPASRDRLIDGLPLPEGRLTPDLLGRAAARAGLTGGRRRMALGRIAPRALPCILLMRDGGSCVLLRRPDASEAELLLPEAGGGISRRPITELEAAYSGTAFFARPVAGALAGEAPPVPSRRHWFRAAMARSWSGYGQVIVASLLINLFALAVPIFMMNVYDRVVPNQALETLWALAVGVAIVLGFDFLLRTLRGYFVDAAARAFDVEVSAALFERILALRLEYRPPAAGLLASHLREFESLRDFLTSATMLGLVDLPFAVLFLAAVAALGGSLALAPAAGLACALAVGLAVQWPLLGAVRQTYAEIARRQGLLVEAIGGLETVKVTGAAGQFQARWEAASETGAQAALRARFLSGLAVNLTLLVSNVVTVTVIVLGVHRIGAGQLTVGALVACTILSARALAPAAQMAAVVTRLGQAVAALRTLGQIMRTPVERPEGKAYLDRPDLEGAVELADVTFAYPGQDTLALNGLSLRIGAGERVALIGRNGSGKSTVARLLLGLYEPQKGAVRIGGTDIRQIDPAALRRRIGYVAQDVYLFAGSVRDNVALGAPWADEATILEAAEAAGADDFLRLDPAGFDRAVGERGQRLSGGQRQAVGLARALLFRPPILLLDEPTSAMDMIAESRFKARVATLPPSETLVLITHRSPLLDLVSRVIVLDAGRVVADGPRERVLQALAQGQIRGVAAQKP